VKTSDKFRFTLQWGAETGEKIQAGEFLESLGNKKSEFVVMAVAEYIRSHPEALTPGQKLRIVVQQNFTKEQVEAIVRGVLEERMAGSPPFTRDNSVITAIPAESEPDLDEMLKNLEVFSQM